MILILPTRLTDYPAGWLLISISWITAWSSIGLTCALPVTVGDCVATAELCPLAPFRMSLMPELSPPSAIPPDPLGGTPPGPPDGIPPDPLDEDPLEPPEGIAPELLDEPDWLDADALDVTEGILAEEAAFNVLKVSLMDWSVKPIAPIALSWASVKLP
jgi:hypothetical protein